MNWSDFQGVNRAYVIDLYEQWQHDPASLDESTRELLDGLGCASGLRRRRVRNGRAIGCLGAAGPAWAAFRLVSRFAPSISRSPFAGTAIWRRRSIRSRPRPCR
jgi:2-oxoglutarate dehydrogenase complex dehydrogenase (E1) component-like enzyme